MRELKEYLGIKQTLCFYSARKTIAINRVIDYTNNPEKHTEFLEMRADIMMMKG